MLPSKKCGCMNPWSLLRYGKTILKKNKELGFKRSSVVNVFKTQKTDNKNMFLATNNTNLELVAAGCTCKCQPLDVCINNPFIDALRNLS